MCFIRKFTGCKMRGKWDIETHIIECRKYLGGRVVDKSQEAFVKEMQLKLERKIQENEIAVIEYWQSQLGRLLAMKPEGVAALQMQIKKIHDMMANRIQILKRA
jgi:hypothetical protein